MSFEGHGSAQTRTISLYIQQNHFRGPKNMDPLIKDMEKGYNRHINAIKLELK